jgi:hypothetical protein
MTKTDASFPAAVRSVLHISELTFILEFFPVTLH